jgi:hypothetical protein
MARVLQTRLWKVHWRPEGTDVRGKLNRITALVAAAASLALAAPAARAGPLTSNVFGASVDPIVFSAGVPFDLQSVDLALGPHNPPGGPQTITVLATFADSTTQNFNLSVGYGFHAFGFGLANLDSVAFTAPQYSDIDFGILAFDNLQFSTSGGPMAVDFEDQIAGTVVNNDLQSGGGDFKFYWGVIYGPADPVDFPTSVPEPAEWALMILGLVGSGLMLRKARRLAAVKG